MKKLILVILGLAVLSSGAMAVSIDLMAYVNPNYNDSWNSDTLTGTALYTFCIDPLSPSGANYLKVSFENDIFSGLGNAGLLTSQPWSLAYDDTSSTQMSYGIAFGGQDVLLPGQRLSVWVEYSLLSLERYYQDSGDGWAWNEGGRWEQPVSALNTLVSDGYGVSPSGGTSTTPVPEPASLMLMLGGLSGAAFLRKKKI